MSRPDWSWRALWIGWAVVLVALGGLSFDRARRGKYDFHHFYLDARYVWEHGELNPQLTADEPDDRRQLPFYLPFVPLVLSPLAAVGRAPAAGLWTLAQMAALACSLRVLVRWGRHTRPDAPAAAPLGVATILALPAFIEAARFNQLSFFILALVLGGLVQLEQRRDWLGGGLLGLAAAAKLLPAVFLPWLILKRRWRAVGGLLVAGVLATILPPLFAWGPGQAAEYHVEWWRHNVRGDAARGMLNPALDEHFVDRRNQSITQVIARWSWSQHPYRLERQPVHLDAQTCTWLGRGVKVLLAILLLWLARRPARDLEADRWRAEAAVCALAMLVFSPLLRQYYLVWALPGLVLLARWAVDGATPRVRRIGWTGVIVWTAGMAAWIFPITRVLGAHLAMLIALGALLLAGSRRPTRTAA